MASPGICSWMKNMRIEKCCSDVEFVKEFDTLKQLIISLTAETISLHLTWVAVK